MYVPKLYAVTDKQRSYDFIRNNGFGILFSYQGSGPVASHLPFVISEEPDGQDFILGHMARANDHWRHADGNEVMVVFHGPHAYISPAWYQEPETVPTWNYAVVHVYGTFEALHERQDAVEVVQQVVDYYESFLPQPWKADFDSPYNRKMIKGVTAFRIRIDRVVGKWKLGQNRPPYLRRRAIDVLKTLPGENEQAIAKLMKAEIENNGEPQRPA